MHKKSSNAKRWSIAEDARAGCFLGCFLSGWIGYDLMIDDDFGSDWISDDCGSDLVEGHFD